MGLAGLLDGFTGDFRRFLHLPPDLVDGRCHLLAGGSDGLHIGRSFFRRRRDHGGEFLRPLRGRGQGAGRGLKLGRGRRYGLDDFPDRTLERIGELRHRSRPFLTRGLFERFPLGLHAEHLDRVFLEHQQRAGDRSHFIPTVCAGNVDRYLAAGKLAHGRRYLTERAHHAAYHHPERERRENQREGHQEAIEHQRPQTAVLGCLGQPRGFLTCQRAQRDHFVDRRGRLAEPFGRTDRIGSAASSRGVDRLARILETAEHAFTHPVGFRAHRRRRRRFGGVGLHVVPGCFHPAPEPAERGDLLRAHRPAGGDHASHRGAFATEIFAHDPDEMLEILEIGEERLDVVLVHCRSHAKVLACDDRRRDRRRPFGHYFRLAPRCGLDDFGIGLTTKLQNQAMRTLGRRDDLLTVGKILDHSNGRVARSNA